MTEMLPPSPEAQPLAVRGVLRALAEEIGFEHFGHLLPDPLGAHAVMPAMQKARQNLRKVHDDLRSLRRDRGYIPRVVVHPECDTAFLVATYALELLGEMKSARLRPMAPCEFTVQCDLVGDLQCQLLGDGDGDGGEDGGELHPVAIPRMRTLRQTPAVLLGDDADLCFAPLLDLTHGELDAWARSVTASLAFLPETFFHPHVVTLSADQTSHLLALVERIHNVLEVMGERDAEEGLLLCPWMQALESCLTMLPLALCARERTRWPAEAGLQVMALVCDHQQVAQIEQETGTSGDAALRILHRRALASTLESAFGWCQHDVVPLSRREPVSQEVSEFERLHTVERLEAWSKSADWSDADIVVRLTDLQRQFEKADGNWRRHSETVRSLLRILAGDVVDCADDIRQALVLSEFECSTDTVFRKVVYAACARLLRRAGVNHVNGIETEAGLRDYEDAQKTDGAA